MKRILQLFWLGAVPVLVAQTTTIRGPGGSVVFTGPTAVPVTATGAVGGATGAISDPARLCFMPVDATGAPTGFRVGTYQVYPVEQCRPLVAGTIAPRAMDIFVTPTGTGVYYHVYIKAANANTVLEDLGTTSVTGTSWSLDTYDPNFVTIPVSSLSMGVTTTGAAGTPATCSLTSGLPGLLNCTIPRGADGSQQVTGFSGDGAGNATLTGALNAGLAINGYQYVTATHSLSAANAALYTGGTLYQNTASVLSSVQQIGINHYPVEWKLSLAQGPVQLSTGGGIQLCDSSQMIGPTTFEPSGGSGLSPGTVYVPSTALVADVVAPCKIDNTQEAMGVTNVAVLASASASPITITGTITAGSASITGATIPTGVSILPGNVVTGAAFYPGTEIVSVVGATITLAQPAAFSGTSATVSGAQFHSAGIFSGTVLRNVSGEGTHTGLGLLVDGGIAAASPGYSTDIEVDGYRFWGAVPNASGLPAVAVWAIPGSTGSSGISNITMMHGDAEGCSTGAPLVDMNGFSNGSGGGHVSGVYGATLDLEARAVCNGVHVQDAHTVEMLNITAEAPGAQTGPLADNNTAAVVYINESYPGSTTQVHVSGYNSDWPTTVLDWVGAADFTNLNADISVGCTSVVVSGIPANTVAPLAGQPIEIMDGIKTEVVYAAWGTGTGTTITVDPAHGCVYSHSHTAYPVPSVVWNPKWVHGPGPAGLYAGRVSLPAGSMSTDTNGVVTVTVPTDSYVYEDRHIGEYVTLATSGADITNFGSGQVQITGLGPYCTNSSAAQVSCSNSAFQYHGPATGSAFNVNTNVFFADTVATFDYTEAGDSTYVSYGPGNHIPEIRGSVNVREGANPAALTVSAFDSDNHEYYSSLFLGPGAKLLYPNATPNDLFAEAECVTTAGFAVNCGALHLRTGPGDNNDTFLGAHGVDSYGISAGGAQQLYRVGSGSPYVPDIGHNFTWTASQTFGAQTYFTATTIFSAGGTATSGANYASAYASWAASVWSGSAAISDSVSATYSPSSGLNPQTTLIFSRSSANTGYGSVLFSGGFDRIGTVNKANGQTSYLNFTNVNHAINYYLVDSTANQYLLAGPNTKGLTEGVVTLSSGAATVSTTAACTPGASCVYALTDCGAAGSTLGSRFGVGTVVAGTSFVIDAWSTAKAVVTTDTSVVCWAIH